MIRLSVLKCLGMRREEAYELSIELCKARLPRVIEDEHSVYHLDQLCLCVGVPFGLRICTGVSMLQARCRKWGVAALLLQCASSFSPSNTTPSANIISHTH